MFLTKEVLKVKEYRLTVKLNVKGSFKVRKYLAENLNAEYFAVILYDKVKNEPTFIVENYDCEEVIPFLLHNRKNEEFEYHFLYNGPKSPSKIIPEIEEADSIISYHNEGYNT